MGGSYFDQIAHKILEQKQLMETLAEENRALRQQLADLRAGKGIFIDIHGQRFALQHHEKLLSTSTDSAQQTVQESEATMVPSMPADEISEATAPQAEATQEQQQHAPAFLEEVMLDEFATAMTNPMQTIEHRQNQQQQKSNEEQKALLRRELLDSYILE
ncbi:MAG TPA: hypothetical protein VHZ51_19050 [Ktedonobacteraceae bacterium]|jgi:hypothetical protein|nr:hypothetical protein [Ktedonobacteraceae bacterium]